MDYENKLVLAPMVRVGTLPFRLLAAQYGADITYGEEIIDHKLMKCQRRVNGYVGTIDFVEKGTKNVVFRTCPEERGQVVLQLGTSDAIRALTAAQLVCKDVAAVDINMGCPKSFSISGGMGAALLTKPEIIHDILTTLKRNLDIPLTCKIRLLKTSRDTVELARKIEKTGVSALAVHGRRVPDRPRDPAKWNEIADIVAALSIPVIANGDVFNYEDFQCIKLATGASSVMVARGALWNASIFSAQGKLPWEAVKREYVRKSILWDNDVKSTKHTLKEIINHYSSLELAEGKAVIKSETLADLAQLYGEEEYYQFVHRSRLMRETIDILSHPIEERLRQSDNSYCESGLRALNGAEDCYGCIRSSYKEAKAADDAKSLLVELKSKLKEVSPITQFEGTQNELNVALSKYTKQLEKSFNPDISKAYRNVDFEIRTVNQIIASHLYRQGLFDVGDSFIHEAGDEELAAMKSPFIELYCILDALKSSNLDPALKWAAANRDELKRNGSDLELKLHRQQYVEILQQRGRDEALRYAKTFIKPFALEHMAVFQKLMACLLWAGKLDSSPYFDVLSLANWDQLAEEVTRQFCSLLGESFENPLSVTVAAAAQGLPTLLRLTSIMAGKKQEWQSMKQLPVPVDLGREFQFHTVFVCPVSREQATDENPAMLMPCGHALCRQSIVKLSKSSTKSFKCPYCPAEVDASRCKQLCF
ncbi:hypothetical protein Nepgr_027119 [Nepenthes gracilis]|uniref:Uncharacterized protein n=1 Tax=Nepenthes gracilis TaxID=150966 RepID=A0AAD3Y383_NEPGR|nr:hypothetical protein Nepgr_027119 [Nepenthes gracilis]